jgi:hypothetical protein
MRAATLSPAEPQTVLEKHQQWLKDGGDGSDERRANLCQAVLTTPTQQAHPLTNANLQEGLSGANLQQAHLTTPTPAGAPVRCHSRRRTCPLPTSRRTCARPNPEGDPAPRQPRRRPCSCQPPGGVLEPTSLPTISGIARAEGLSTITFSPLPQLSYARFKRQGSANKHASSPMSLTPPNNAKIGKRDPSANAASSV